MSILLFAQLIAQMSLAVPPPCTSSFLPDWECGMVTDLGLGINLGPAHFNGSEYYVDSLAIWEVIAKTMSSENKGVCLLIEDGKISDASAQEYQRRDRCGQL